MPLLERVLHRLTGSIELDPAQEGAAMQVASENYWRDSANTYLGGGEYYDRKARVLDGVLAGIPRFTRGLDVGCGDGRYTLQLAEHADHVEGRDIGPALIETARLNAANLEVRNVTYRVASAGEPLDNGYDLLAALGVTSCIVDDAAFESFLASLGRAATPGGTLLLIDSLAKRSDMLSRFSSGYVARYRQVDDYLAAVNEAGFDLIEERDLGSPSPNPIIRLLPGRKINRLYRFTRR